MNVRELSAIGFNLVVPQEPTGQSRAVVGWTNPTITYDSQRRIDREAAMLDGLIRANVIDEPFRAAWQTWYEGNWKPFFAKYAGDDSLIPYGKLGAVASSDAIARETETQSQYLNGFVADYNRQRTRTGQLVPQTRVPPLEQPLVEGDKKESGWTLPWWAWMLGGVAVVGVGYWGYRKYQQAQQAKKTIYEGVLPNLIGPGLAKSAQEANRDPDFGYGYVPAPPTYPMMAPLAPRQPRPEAPPPVTLKTMADYASDPRAAMPVVYRPYEHPHVVPAAPAFRDYDDGGDESHDDDDDDGDEGDYDE